MVDKATVDDNDDLGGGDVPTEVVFTDEEGNEDSVFYTPLPAPSVSDLPPYQGPVIEAAEPGTVPHDPTNPFDEGPPEDDPRREDWERWREEAVHPPEDVREIEEVP